MIRSKFFMPSLILVLGLIYFLNTSSKKVLIFYFFIFSFFFLFSLIKKNFFIISSISFVLFFILLIIYELSSNNIVRYYKNLDLKINFKKEVKGLDRVLNISTDKNGFRNTGYNQKFKKKIIFIGGSTTLQLMHSDKKTTAGYLQKTLLNNGYNYQVINTGVSGLRSMHHLNHLKYFFKNKKYFTNENIYIILVGANDINYNVKNYFYPKKWYKFFNADDVIFVKIIKEIVYKLRDKSALKYTKDTTFENDASKVYFSNRGTYNDKDKILLNRKDYKKLTNLIKNDISLIHDECQKNKLNCVILNQPSLYSLKNQNKQNIRNILWGIPPFEDYTLNFADSSEIFNDINQSTYNLKCSYCFNLNINELFDYQDQFFIDEIHFSKEGVKFLEKNIFNFLIKKKIINKNN